MGKTWWEIKLSSNECRSKIPYKDYISCHHWKNRRDILKDGRDPLECTHVNCPIAVTPIPKYDYNHTLFIESDFTEEEIARENPLAMAVIYDGYKHCKYCGKEGEELKGLCKSKWREQKDAEEAKRLEKSNENKKGS